MVLFLLVGSIVQRLLLARENKKRLAGQRDGWIAGKSEAEIDMLGDKRYAKQLLIEIVEC